MADVWDPFADPADLVAAPTSKPSATASGTLAGPSDVIEEDDILSAWRALIREATSPDAPSTAPTRSSPALSPEALEVYLTSLFDTTLSLDEREEAFNIVASEAELRWEVRVALWRRGIPLVMDEALRAQHSALFGWLVEFESGLRRRLTSADKQEANEVVVDPPTDVAGVDPLAPTTTAAAATSPSSKLVIFVFGWGGGSAAELTDVVEAYRALCPSALLVRLAWNAKESWAMRRACAIALQHAARFWVEGKSNNDHQAATSSPPPPPQLLVHLFSNSGFMTWTEMLRTWRAACEDEDFAKSLSHPLPSVDKVLRGVILDSACNEKVTPEACVRSAVQSLAAFLHRVEASDHDGSEAAARAAELRGRKVKFVLLGPKSPVNEYLLAHEPDRLVAPSCADTAMVHRLEPPCETLFIYSKDDQVILPEGVEEYLEAVRQRLSGSGCGAPDSLVFEESPHVLHKIKFKDQYWSTITNLLKKLSLTGNS